MLQISFCDSMAVSFDDPILMGELEQSWIGIDGTRNVLVDQRRVDQEAFAEVWRWSITNREDVTYVMLQIRH